MRMENCVIFILIVVDVGAWLSWVERSVSLLASLCLNPILGNNSGASLITDEIAVSSFLVLRFNYLL